MQLSFDLINSLVIHPYQGVDDSRLKKNLLEISTKFTKNRDQISDYVSSDEFVSAYTLFYFPTGFVKFDWLMNRIPYKVIESMKQMNFIDVGTGPGTYVSAFLDLVGESYQGEVKLIESSPAMLKQAKKTISKLFPQFHGLVEGSQFKGIRKNILFFGNSFNEIGPTEAKKLIIKYDPELIIFVEPGTKDVFNQIIHFRDDVLGLSYNQVYPCPSSKNCPMKNTDDWCHQIIHTTHHPSIEQLSQIIHKDRRTMPLIAHVYSKESVDLPSTRTVRIFPETKFSFEFQVCRDNQLLKFETMKKHYSKDQKNEIEELSVGDTLEINIEKTLPDGKIRGQIYSPSSTKK
jgi:uncharacterized protein (DUF1499 family)